MQYKTELERILTRELRKRHVGISDVSITGDGVFALYHVADRYTVRKLSAIGKEFLRSGRMTSGSPEDCLVGETSIHRRSERYRCRDCGGEVGVRSRRRKWIERYILPILLLKPVRCASCFRRDYWLVSTPTYERADAINLTRHAPRKSGLGLSPISSW